VRAADGDHLAERAERDRADARGDGYSPAMPPPETAPRSHAAWPAAAPRRVGRSVGDRGPLALLLPPPRTLPNGIASLQGPTAPHARVRCQPIARPIVG
jgi:hypothetical protein